MTIEDFLPRLEEVRRSSRGFRARCPSHVDRRPSLSVTAGRQGIPLHCWAGCRAEDIVGAMGLTLRDLFDQQVHNSHDWKQSKQVRDAERQRQEDREYVLGLKIDSRREADRLLASVTNPGLVGWGDDQIHAAMNAVADAYDVLFAERVENGDYPF